jgi:hypothetical protein
LFSLTGDAFSRIDIPSCPETVEKRDCTGTWTSPTGYFYRGEFKGNKFIGETENGIKIDVEFRGGQPNGKGTYTLWNGEQYVGEWRDGEPHGQGTYSWPKGERYVGEFRDGTVTGQGTLTRPDGLRYVGEFRDGKYTGQGTLTLPNGERYVGEFRFGKYTGQGTLTQRDGERYVGEFRDGRFSGQGTLTRDGVRYVGEFRDNRLNGQGIAYLLDGSILRWDGVLQSGRWVDGKLVQSFAIDIERFPFDTGAERAKRLAKNEAEKRAAAEEREAQRQSDLVAIARWNNYQKRQKTLLEQVLNYTMTTLEDGSASEFWISGENGQHKCVLTRYSVPASEARSLAEAGAFGEAMARRMLNPGAIDFRMFNPSGVRFQKFNHGTNVGDENMRIIGHPNTVTDRLRKGWGLALQECPPAQRRAF